MPLYAWAFLLDRSDQMRVYANHARGSCQRERLQELSSTLTSGLLGHYEHLLFPAETERNGSWAGSIGRVSGRVNDSRACCPGIPARCESCSRSLLCLHHESQAPAAAAAPRHRHITTTGLATIPAATDICLSMATSSSIYVTIGERMQSMLGRPLHCAGRQRPDCRRTAQWEQARWPQLYGRGRIAL
jgi:hypothetical protein